MTDPHSTYTELLPKRRAEIKRIVDRQRSLGYWRLVVAALALLVVWLALSAERISIAWLAVPIVVFVVLMIVHDRLQRVVDHRRRAERYFERALARLEGNWIGSGETGDRYLDPAHTYAQDLDLFGKGSLFELLCTARTHIGEETLARWLLVPAAPPEVRERNQAVAELRPRLDLREDLAVLAEEARTGVAPAALAAWGEAPPLLTSGGLRVLLWALTATGLLGLLALFGMVLGVVKVFQLSDTAATVQRDVFLIVAVVNSIFLYRWRREFSAVVEHVEEAAHELGLVSQVLVRLEREKFQSPMLARLRASLDVEDDPPSQRLARLKKLIEYLDSRDNVFVRIFEIFILWTPHLAVSVEDWRRHSGPAVRRWLTAMGEIEALASLSSHAFEHPADPFPEFAPDAPLLEAEAIGHPLLPEGRVVRNDIRIGGAGPAGPRVIIVSGSNMSGKSTMLRTLGINAILAQAGAPVRARSLQLSPLAVGASIRVSDSLQGGVSRFYAEILRLRQILDLTAGRMPVLFLIDEFLHGTNSHDRRIGAEALVRGLVDRGAVGLITTHDLALAEVADTLGDKAANVHFEDQVENGEIRFDYRMRPGVVRKSNAIELMRSVGLEI
jgi:hypothetical protein